MTSPLMEAETRLDESQRAALDTTGDTVVLAGPGSGKTAILVLKVARLLRDLPPARSLACITFGNDAAREFTERLSVLGIRPGRRLILGTVHAFCLRAILGPHADLAGRADLASPLVLAQRASQAVLQETLDGIGLNEPADRYTLTVSRLRQARVAGIEPIGFADVDFTITDAYEALLRERHAVDFDGIVFEALNLVRNHAWIRSLVATRFSWLVVDEYQDLTRPLHELLLLLHEGGSRLFAVGDPDQSIFAFSGGEPANLENLALNTHFQVVRLPFNYRSGSRLIAASQAALDHPRGYRPDPLQTDAGEIFFEEVEGGFEAQAAEIAHNVVPSLLLETRLDQIGVFVRQRGRLLNLIDEAIAEAGFPVASERDDRWPRSPVVRFLREAATYATHREEPLVAGLGSLERQLAAYARFPTERGRDRLARLRGLLDVLRATALQPLGPWLDRFDLGVGLTGLLSAYPEYAAELEDLEAVRATANADPGPTVGDFAAGSSERGKLVLTTYHGAKGREFDAVVMPGLQDQLFPRASWDRSRRRWQWRDDAVAEERRLFYVGLTRARHRVVLMWSPSWVNPSGYRQTDGPSRFVSEVQGRLAEGSANGAPGH